MMSSSNALECNKQDELYKYSFRLSTLIMQPTTFCNIDCKYCYLSNRSSAQNMTCDLARVIANRLDIYQPINLVWHSGEPLSVGIEKFRELISPFEDLRKSGLLNHSIQTNGTLINRDWIDIFIQHNIDIGISIDGDFIANSARLSRSGSATHQNILKGIDGLNARNVPFHCIAVIGSHNIDRPAEIYNFFAQIGCTRLAVNIAEKDGGNKYLVPDRSEVSIFWKKLFNVWLANPVLPIREFERSVNWIKKQLEGGGQQKKWRDWTGSIDTNGNFRVLSPEFSEVKSEKYDDFIIGNILDANISELLRIASESDYVRDFVKGGSMCEEICAFFDYCGGGSAANKFSENGILQSTETDYCFNSRQSPLEAALEGFIR